VDLGADPVNAKRNESHVDVRIEALDGLHEAYVALLDQVSHRQPVPAVAAGDVHYESQMRKNELACGLEVVVAPEALGQLALFLAAENGNTADPVQISIQAPQRTGQRQVTITGDDCGTCGH
jgi:hypothetical protein